MHSVDVVSRRSTAVIVIELKPLMAIDVAIERNLGSFAKISSPCVPRLRSGTARDAPRLRPGCTCRPSAWCRDGRCPSHWRQPGGRRSERRKLASYVPKLHTGPLLDLLAAVFDTIFQKYDAPGCRPVTVNFLVAPGVTLTFLRYSAGDDDVPR